MSHQPSHRLSQHDDKVVIHDLELFVGFDPSIDDPDDETMKKYDGDRINEVIRRTQAYMTKGQNPKLILGHNPDEDDGMSRPAIGDVIDLRFGEIGGVPGIIGDVEMPFATFEASIQSNAYPRRSAEIWSDGYLSEIALLGSQTPARPLPDTKFDREGLQRDCFSRTLPVLKCAAGDMMEPGPHNNPPSGSTTMPCDEDKMKAMEEENEQLKAQLAKYKAEEDEEDDKDKEKNRRGSKSKSSTRTVEIERDEFRRRCEMLESSNADMRHEWLAERYDRELDALENSDYIVADRKEVHKRILSAADPGSSLEDAKAACDDQLKFIKSLLPKAPVNRRIDQAQASLRLSGDAREQHERQERAAEEARDFCVREGITDPAKYQAKYRELLKTG